ncbi:MAG: ATP-grasp domain-containing protein [Minicystis sp.]
MTAPTLVLSHRYSPDSNALFTAALAAGWDVERLHTFRCPEGLAARDPVFYGETILADAITDDLGIALLEPTADWLPRLPQRHRLRDVRLVTLAEALAIRERVFVKPTDEKCFPARVYADGAAIDPDPVLPQDLPVLVSEPVVFEIEFRFFVVERRVSAFSPYIRGGQIARDAAGDWAAEAADVEAARASIHALLADGEVELAARGGRRRRAHGGSRLGCGGGEPRVGLGALRLRSGRRAPGAASGRRGAEPDHGRRRALGAPRRLRRGGRAVPVESAHEPSFRSRRTHGTRPARARWALDRRCLRRAILRASGARRTPDRRARAAGPAMELHGRHRDGAWHRRGARF